MTRRWSEPVGGAGTMAPAIAVVALACAAAVGCGRNETSLGDSTSSTGTSATSSTASATASASSAGPVASNVPPHVEAATLATDAATVDGLEMSKISCRSTAPLEGKDSILAALAAKRGALDDCIGAATTLRVHFAFDDGKTGDVRVEGAPNQKAARCVAAAIKAASFPKRGACALSLKLGVASEGG